MDSSSREGFDFIIGLDSDTIYWLCLGKVSFQAAVLIMVGKKSKGNFHLFPALQYITDVVNDQGFMLDQRVPESKTR